MHSHIDNKITRTLFNIIQCHNQNEHPPLTETVQYLTWMVGLMTDEFCEVAS